MNNKQVNRIIYSIAEKYLDEICPNGEDIFSLEKYFIGDDAFPESIEDVFRRMIASAQNSERMINVIKFWKREDEIREMLSNYNISIISQMSEEALNSSFRERFKVVQNDSPRSCLRKWCRATIDSAVFLSRFKDIKEFELFVENFQCSSATRVALPLYIAANIRGIGFTLACDFLKELGYLEYPKPDIHLTDICEKLGLSDRNPIHVCEAIIEMANDCDESPYKVDKVIWLICTGRFYLGLTDSLEPYDIGPHKNEFLAKAKIALARSV